jgi:hypothetical protein
MGKFVIYRKPAVKDKHYSDYDWVQEKTPFESRSEARRSMPDPGSPVGEGYVFKLAEFDESVSDIPGSLTDSEIREHT